MSDTPLRIPLRPLARILPARAKGENPDAIERENIRQRHAEMQDRARVRAESRLLVLGLFFFCAFTVVGGRMGLMGEAGPEAILPLARGADGQLGVRADGGGRGPVSVVINVTTPDVEGFRRSEAQIAGAMARLLERGARVG